MQKEKKVKKLTLKLNVCQSDIHFADIIYILL